MLKIAILGGTSHETQSDEARLAFNLAKDLAKAGHEIWACGGNGVPLAAVRGAYKAERLSPKCWVDMGDTAQIPHGACNEDDYFTNAKMIHNNPDVHIFVDSGTMGTEIQLSTMLMHAFKGLKDVDDMCIIIYHPFSQKLVANAQRFCADVGEKLPRCVHLSNNIDGLLDYIATS